jgi:2-isopropylmalate synthase
MRPETVGATQSLLVLGKHSGRHAFAARLEELGLALQADQLDKAFESFKQLADRKKQVTDADIEALVTSEFYQRRDFYRLDGLQVACGTMGLPTATVRLRVPDGSLRVRATVGTGPVDAAFKAIDNIVQAENTLLEYSVHAVTEGIDALGEVSVRIRAEVPDPRTDRQGMRSHIFRGHGADTDVIVASARAYLAALNRVVAARKGTDSEPPQGRPAA